MRNSTTNNGYTKVQNIFIDGIFPTLSPAAQLILLKIIRQTVGWQGKRILGDKISYSQFRKATGYSDNTAISKGLKQLMERELIVVEGKGTETRKFRVNWETIDKIMEEDYKLNLGKKVQLEEKVSMDSNIG